MNARPSFRSAADSLEISASLSTGAAMLSLRAYHHEAASEQAATATRVGAMPSSPQGASAKKLPSEEEFNEQAKEEQEKEGEVEEEGEKEKEKENEEEDQNN